MDSTPAASTADDALIVATMCDTMGEVLATLLVKRIPELDVDGWASAAAAEVFSACQDVTACAIFANGGEIV